MEWHNTKYVLFDKVGPRQGGSGVRRRRGHEEGRRARVTAGARSRSTSPGGHVLFAPTIGIFANPLNEVPKKLIHNDAAHPHATSLLCSGVVVCGYRTCVEALIRA